MSRRTTIAIALLLATGPWLHAPPNMAVREQVIIIDEGHVQWGPSTGATRVTPDDGPPPAGPETVWTKEGNVLNGTVLGIDPDGMLRMTGPTFVGEVKVRAASIGRLTLKPDTSTDGCSQVDLTNGDFLRGDIVEITDETVTLRTNVAGVLKIPRRFVASISWLGSPLTVLEGDFASGKMTPWEVRSGNWKVSDGRLWLLENGTVHAVYAKLDQDEAVTMTAEVEGTADGPFQCELVLFADNLEGPSGQASVSACVTKGRCFLQSTTRGASAVRLSGGLQRSFYRGTLSFAYDPRTRKASLWRDGAPIGQCTMPEGPTRGGYVMFKSQYACRLTHLRVERGFMPSQKEPERPQAEGAEDLVVFLNGDRVSARSVSLTDAGYVVETDMGRLTASRDQVRWISMGQSAREKPAVSEGSLNVHLLGGHLTLRPRQMTAECLQGESACLGEVRIRRDALRSIRAPDFKVEVNRTSATRIAPVQAETVFVFD